MRSLEASELAVDSQTDKSRANHLPVLLDWISDGEVSTGVADIYECHTDRIGGPEVAADLSNCSRDTTIARGLRRWCFCAWVDTEYKETLPSEVVQTLVVVDLYESYLEERPRPPHQDLLSDRSLGRVNGVVRLDISQSFEGGLG